MFLNQCDMSKQFEDGEIFSFNRPTNLHPQTFKRLITKFLKKLRQGSNTSLTYASTFSQNINLGALSCFAEFCSALAQNQNIREINLSGCNINVYYAIELSKLVQNNTNIEVLQLGSCNLNSFSLSCIFKAMIDHTGLIHLNLFNNQSFTLKTMQDFCKYVLKGKNPLIEINLGHCNIDHYCLSLMFPNLKFLKSLKILKIGMMQFNSECILALASALKEYTGNLYLDYLDLSYNQINNEGFELLSGAFSISVRQINIKSLNLSKNNITQEGVDSIEQILLKLNIEDINLSQNQIVEFKNQHVFSKQMSRINLSFNKIIEIPNNFFLHVFSLNLSNNQLTTQAAYQLSQVLTSRKLQWKELNLNNNQILTKGFISIIYALIENKSVISLSVANNQIQGEAVLVYIFNHEQLNLEYLDLSQNIIRYDLVHSLIQMMKECKLSTLVLNYLNQNETEISTLTTELFELKCNNLRELNFQGNPSIIGPIIASLAQHYNRIEYLNLSYCSIQSQSIELLAKYLGKTFSLTTLNLTHNHLGLLDDKTLRTLEQGFSRNNSLISLDLSSNKLKSKIIYLVNGLMNCAQLRYLSLRNNFLIESDEVIKQLPYILRNQSLFYVDFSQNYISTPTLLKMDSTQRKFNRRFPQLNLSNQKLTADDLLAFSRIVANSFNSIQLQGNLLLDYLNNILPLENNVVQSLSVNKISFREDSYKNYLLTIDLNHRNLQYLEISNTFLSQNQLIHFLEALQQLRNLQGLQLDNQLMEDDGVLIALSQLMPRLKKLIYFSVRKSSLSKGFYQIVQFLLQKSRVIRELDLSHNKITNYDFNCLGEGLKSNVSLENLNLANSQMDDISFQILVDSIEFNKNLIFLDISENDISQQSYGYLLKLSQQIKQLIIVNSKGSLLFGQYQKQIQTYSTLVTLDISKNTYSPDQLSSILEKCGYNQILNKLTQLNLDNSLIGDDHCIILGSLLNQYPMINNLSISKNQITSNGFGKIMNFILLNTSQLRYLDVSKNKIRETFISQLQQFKLKYLQIILLDGNLSDGLGQKGFLNLLIHNPTLYIYNDWRCIDGDLAKQIVESYIRISTQYQLKENSNYCLKSMVIRDSNLSDQFFTWFGANYFRFPLLEIINFSGNNKITSIGKMHMSINIFSETSANQQLREAYLDLKEKNTNHTILDDGIITFLLFKLKYWLRNNKTPQSQNNYSAAIVEQLAENIKWGFVGKWTIHLINKLLSFLQIMIIDFKISNSLNMILRQNERKIKFLLVFGIVIEVLRFLISAFMTLFIVFNEQKIVPNEKYYYNNQIYTQILLIILLSVIRCSLNLWASIQIRSLNSDTIIQNKIDKLRIRIIWPLKKELIKALLEFTLQFNYTLECLIIVDELIMNQYLEQQQISNKDFIEQRFMVNIIYIRIILCYQIIIFLYFSIKSSIQLWNNFKTDQGTFFHSIWYVAYVTYNYQLENQLNSYCPQSALKFRKTLYNSKQIYEICMALIVDFPLILAYLQHKQIKIKYNLIFYRLYDIIDVGLLICIFRFLYHTVNSLACRPPQIKEFDLNEVLLFRRYQQIKLQRILIFDNLSYGKKQSKATTENGKRNQFEQCDGPYRFVHQKNISIKKSLINLGDQLASPENELNYSINDEPEGQINLPIRKKTLIRNDQRFQ